MTLFVMSVVTATLAAAGLLLLAFPPRTNLTTAIDRWDTGRRTASRSPALTTHQGGSQSSAWLGMLAEHALQLWRTRTTLVRQRTVAQDLAVTGATLEAHALRIIVLAAVGFAAPLLLCLVFSAVGVFLPVWFALLAALSLGGAMPYVVHRELRDNAIKRRAEFRRGLSLYLDLVAMSMEAGRGHAEALPASAQIGHGWAFTVLADAITGARYSGITPWRALGDLGDRYGIVELVDLEAALALAVDDGAHIRASLVARAETLRARRIADTRAAAASATESMRFALIVMVFAFLCYELFPPVTRLFAG